MWLAAKTTEKCVFVLWDGAYLLRYAECLELCGRHTGICSIRINIFCPPSCPWAIASPTLKLIVLKMLNADWPRFAEQQMSVDNIHCLIIWSSQIEHTNVEHAIFPLMLKKHLVNKFEQHKCYLGWFSQHKGW